MLQNFFHPKVFMMVAGSILLVGCDVRSTSSNPPPEDPRTDSDTHGNPLDPPGAPCTSNDSCDAGFCLLVNAGTGFCSMEGCLPGECGEGLLCLPANNTTTCTIACESQSECESFELVCSASGACEPVKSAAPESGESPIGGACTTNIDCDHFGATCLQAMDDEGPTGFIGGYCVLECSANTCPTDTFCHELTPGMPPICLPVCSDKSECRVDEGYLCLPPGLCLPGCDTNTPCPWHAACDETRGQCIPACTSESCGPDLICSETGECTSPPCSGDSCGAGWACLPGGECVPDMEGGPGDFGHPTCDSLPPRDCEGAESHCGEIVPFEPVDGPGYTNYPLNGETAENQYRSYCRRDLRMLIQWATAYVECMAANWPGGAGHPLGLGDMSEADGSIPGTSIGQPGHPAGTHVDGYDMDIAYFMNEVAGANNYLKPICEHTIGGADQYHCVNAPNLLDVWRNALFLGALQTSDRLRVIGVDGKVGPLMGDALLTLCDQGWIPEEGCGWSAWAFTYEETDQGKGWYHFHHHHQHVSLHSVASSTSQNVQREALDEGERQAFIQHLLKQRIPGLIHSLQSP